MLIGTHDVVSGQARGALRQIGGWLDGDVTGAGADSSSPTEVRNRATHNLSFWAHNLRGALATDTRRRRQHRTKVLS